MTRVRRGPHLFRGRHPPRRFRGRHPPRDRRGRHPRLRRGGAGGAGGAGGFGSGKPSRLLRFFRAANTAALIRSSVLFSERMSVRTVINRCCTSAVVLPGGVGVDIVSVNF